MKKSYVYIETLEAAGMGRTLVQSHSFSTKEEALELLRKRYARARVKAQNERGGELRARMTYDGRSVHQWNDTIDFCYGQFEVVCRDGSEIARPTTNEGFVFLVDEEIGVDDKLHFETRGEKNNNLVRKYITEEIDEASVLVNSWNEEVAGCQYEDIKILSVGDDGVVRFKAVVAELGHEIERDISSAYFEDIEGVLACDYIGGGNFRVTVVRDNGNA